MDQISVYFQNRLAQLSVSPNSENTYWETQKLFHQYLVNALRAEIWWRLQSTCYDPTTQALAKQLVRDLSSYRYEQPLTHLADCLQTAFSGDPVQLKLFDQLLQLLDSFAQLRNTPATLDECLDCADALLDQIEDLRSDGFQFPPLSDKWEMIIPLSLEADHWNCIAYREHTRRRSRNYLWVPMQLPADTLEYNAGPDFQSGSCISFGRVYFRRGTQMRCLHPFVQMGFNTEQNEVTSIWVLQQLERLQNGECSGVNLYKHSLPDYRNIPAFILSEQDESNPYVKYTGHQDSEGNFYPLYNRYNDNYPDWCDNLDTINDTITKLQKNLNTAGCSLIYLYGSGGVGKTAAVQKLLNEYNVAKKQHDFDHIIFLSAKKYTWNPTNGQTRIEYDDSKGVQCFCDLPTLRRSLRNILGRDRIRECPAGTDDWNFDHEHLYSGKSILLVLDDFESVDRTSQAEIVAYLEKTFYSAPGAGDLQNPRSGFKRRQAIITSRDSSIECLRSDILLPPLNTEETARLAFHFAKRFHCLDAYHAALGEPGYMLSDAQQRDRRRFRDLSRGKPLMLLSLVRNYPNADFPDSGETEEELLDILTRDIYKYLARNDLAQGLAVLAAHLADDRTGNTTERLQYLFQRWDQSGMHMEHCLQLLIDYSVIQLDNKKQEFTFTSKNMCTYIQQNFESDKDTYDHFPRNLLRMAKWLQLEQQLPIQECLANRLQLQIRNFFSPDPGDTEDADIISLTAAVFGGKQQSGCSRWKLRKTLQTLVAACGKSEPIRYNVDRTLADLIEYYPSELLWFSLYNMFDTFAADDDSFLCRIADILTESFEQYTDTNDRFAQLWCTLQMVKLMRTREIPVPGCWGGMIRGMMLKCRTSLYQLSKEDLNHLTNALYLAKDYLGPIDLCIDDLEAAKSMEGHNSNITLFFAD